MSERRKFVGLSAVSTNSGTFYGVTNIPYGLYLELVKMQALLKVAQKHFSQLDALYCSDNTTTWYEVIPWRAGPKSEARLEAEEAIDRQVDEGQWVPVDGEWLDEHAAVERGEMVRTSSDRMLVGDDGIHFTYYEKYSGEMIHSSSLPTADIEKHFHGG
jgi:hypothetical protein